MLPSNFMSALTSVFIDRFVRLKTYFLYLVYLYQDYRKSWGYCISSEYRKKLYIQWIWSNCLFNSSWSPIRKLSFFYVSAFNSSKAFLNIVLICSSTYVAFVLTYFIFRSILLKSSASWFFLLSMLGSISFTFDAISEYASFSFCKGCFPISPSLWFPWILHVMQRASLHTEQYSSNGLFSCLGQFPNFFGFAEIYTLLCLLATIEDEWCSWSQS